MKNKNTAFLMVLFTYIIWGIQPLYWSLFKGVPVDYIMAHRIFWSVGFVLPVLFITGKQGELVKHFKNPKALAISSFAGIMIGLNWGFNVYAVVTKHIIEASLGHYISPVIIMFIGAVILKEKVQPYKKIAIGLTVIGMMNVILLMGRIPTLAALIIATFVVYTYIKKMNPSEVIVAFLAELVLLAPVALGYLIYKSSQGVPFFYFSDIKSILLLISTGAYTGYALLLFSYGVKEIDFTVLGFIQYLAPTMSLAIGVFVFNEPFTKAHLYSFPFLWMAVLIVVITPIIYSRNNKSLKKKSSLKKSS
jgi:chloramphenicol-sensitive protein RarD